MRTQSPPKHPESGAKRNDTPSTLFNPLIFKGFIFDLLPVRLFWFRPMLRTRLLNSSTWMPLGALGIHKVDDMAEHGLERLPVGCVLLYLETDV